MKRIDWDNVVSTVGEDTVVNFAAGHLSGSNLMDKASFTQAAGEVRSLIRERGVTEARRVARKAMTRRGYTFV